jgi:hypothetical protein
MSLDAVAEGIRFDPPPPREGVEIHLSKGVRDPTLGVEPLPPPPPPPAIRTLKVIADSESLLPTSYLCP